MRPPTFVDIPCSFRIPWDVRALIPFAGCIGTTQLPKGVGADRGGHRLRGRGGDDCFVLGHSLRAVGAFDAVTFFQATLSETECPTPSERESRRHGVSILRRAR